MNKSIFIHIGTHKTGTSIVQKTLIEKSEALKREGVKYINLYKFEGAQKLMLIESVDEILTEQLRIFINSFVDENHSKYILCCEYLSGNPKTLYSNVSVIANILCKAIKGFTEKKIFVALRKQEQFIQSIYTQYLHQAEDISMSTFLDKDKLEYIKWCQFLEKYHSVFGERYVKVVPYDITVLESKNIVNHFGEFSRIASLQDVSVGSSNHGYSKEAIKIAKECNPNLNKEEQKILRLIMQEHLSKEVFSKYELLDNEQVSELDEYFKVDNEKLFKTYFKEYDIQEFSESEYIKDNELSIKNGYSKLTVLLIKKINEFNNSKFNEIKDRSGLKAFIYSSKQILKKGFTKLVKRNDIYDYSDNIELRQRFGGFNNTIILGSASSINKLDVTQFVDDFVITVGNFYEHPEIEKINPKIHIFAASHPPITKTVLINWWTRCNTILPKETSLLIESRDKEVALKVFKSRKVYFYSYDGTLPVDFTKQVMSPWSVTIIALQLAIYCRNKTIGILGVNHDWQCLKPYRHFYDHDKPSLEYYLHKAGIEISYEIQKQPFPKGRLYREYELYQQYETLKSEAKSFNIEILNFDPFSDFDVFEFDKKLDLIIEKE